MQNNLLTNSSTSTYKTCPRRYQLAYEIGLRRDVEGQPLRMGSAYHEGLDAMKSGFTLAEACDQVRLNYAVLPAWANTDEAVEDWFVEREIVLRLLTGWVWRWSETPIEYVASELSFEMPLVNPHTGAASRTFTLAGKIDGIVKLPDGRYAVVEHKTTSDSIDPDSDYWRRLRLDSQITLYFIAARHLGFDVQTVIYDVAKKPGIRPKLIGKGADKHRESIEEFGERFSQDIAERPDHYFGRNEIPRLESDIEEFKSEIWQVGKQLIDARNDGRFFRNTNACLAPFKCTYFALCSNNTDVISHTPSGFVRLTSSLHPELSQEQHHDRTLNTAAQTTADATAAAGVISPETVIV